MNQAITMYTELTADDILGKIKHNAPLSRITWFKTGGPADILFDPFNIYDLSHFLKQLPPSIPVQVIGAGSNIIVRDGGIRGVIIRLGSGFSSLYASNNNLFAGSALLDMQVAQFAAKQNIGGFEFLSGIPGTIGGAIAMNAGAYGREMANLIKYVVAVGRDGTIRTLTNQEMKFCYRGNKLNEFFIFTGAMMAGYQSDKQNILEQINTIQNNRQQSQPTNQKTAGCTFKNPEGLSAWKLIDSAGCRGMQMGGAQISDKHCNFIINNGTATAADLEKLGNKVKDIVKQKHNIALEWEIKIIGTPQE